MVSYQVNRGEKKSTPILLEVEVTPSFSAFSKSETIFFTSPRLISGGCAVKVIIILRYVHVGASLQVFVYISEAVEG